MTDSSRIDSSGTPAKARGSWRINKRRRRRARHSQRVTESNGQEAQADDAHGDDTRADALGEPDSESDNAFEKIMQRKEIREVVSMFRMLRESMASSPSIGYTIGSREDGGVLDGRGQPVRIAPDGLEEGSIPFSTDEGSVGTQSRTDYPHPERTPCRHHPAKRASVAVL